MSIGSSVTTLHTFWEPKLEYASNCWCNEDIKIKTYQTYQTTLEQFSYIRYVGCPFMSVLNSREISKSYDWFVSGFPPCFPVWPGCVRPDEALLSLEDDLGEVGIWVAGKHGTFHVGCCEFESLKKRFHTGNTGWKKCRLEKTWFKYKY